MYALKINDNVLIFDLTKHYGFCKIQEAKLDGFLKILSYDDIIKFCCDYCCFDLSKIEPYSDFLHDVCVKYLKEYFL